jgi:hypothetical protein
LVHFLSLSRRVPLEKGKNTGKIESIYQNKANSLIVEF